MAWTPVRLLTFLGLAGVTVTVLVAVLATATDDTWFDDLWLEVAKAGVQVLGVGVLGGALTYAWKELSTQREKESERRAKIRAELLDIFSLYKDVKSVRRTLRSLGLDPKYDSGGDVAPGAGDGRFTAEQAQAFHQQMDALNSLQLGFEVKQRQFEQTDFLREDTGEVLILLRGIENHLNGVLKHAWEKGGWMILAGSEIEPISRKLRPLLSTSQSRAHVSEPLREITRVINKHVFEEATLETKKLAQRLEEDAGART